MTLFTKNRIIYVIFLVKKSSDAIFFSPSSIISANFFWFFFHGALAECLNRVDRHGRGHLMYIYFQNNFFSKKKSKKISKFFSKFFKKCQIFITYIGYVGLKLYQLESLSPWLSTANITRCTVMHAEDIFTII